jgi:hypothetical protein
VRTDLGVFAHRARAARRAFLRRSAAVSFLLVAAAPSLPSSDAAWFFAPLVAMPATYSAMRGGAQVKSYCGCGKTGRECPIRDGRDAGNGNGGGLTAVVLGSDGQCQSLRNTTITMIRIVGSRMHKACSGVNFMVKIVTPRDRGATTCCGTDLAR